VGCDVLHVEALIYEIDIGDNPQVVAPTSKTHHLFLYLKLSRLGIRVRISAGEEKSVSRTKRYNARMANESLGYRFAASSKGFLKLRASCGRSIRLHYVEHYSIALCRLQYVNVTFAFHNLAKIPT
jgi:hypothetical protein